jgi:uncharacterized lipoprotein YddW (UPF0748 family)
MTWGFLMAMRAGGRRSFRPRHISRAGRLPWDGPAVAFTLLVLTSIASAVFVGPLASEVSVASAGAPAVTAGETTAALTSALPAALIVPDRAAPPSEAWKAVWVKADQLATDRSIRETVRDAAAWGASDLLVQVRVRGDALYPSRLVPASPALTAIHGSALQVLTRDPLRLFIEEAHARGLRVHAWFNCFVAWSGPGDPPPGHALSEHPGWALRLADGRSSLGLSSGERRRARLEGAYLAPGSGDVRRHLLALVDELVRAYPLDGLHWDYVRYPSDSCLDPADPGGDIIADTTRARSQRDAVSRFVAEAAQLARALRPRILLSAAVRPDPQEAVTAVRQDWVQWLREGWIDRAIPMAYTASIFKLDDLRRRSVFAGADSLRLIYGLSADRVESGGLGEQLRWARRRSPSGVCLFAYDHVRRKPGSVRAVEAAWRGPWLAAPE